MKVTLVDQPSGRKTGDRLTTLLGEAASGKYDQVIFVSAFAKRAGIVRLQPALTALKASTSTLTCIVGVDHNGTSREAVNDLFNLSDELFIVHSTRPDVTFHPKAYLFKGPKEASLLIGSSNFTAGGLYTNMELGIELEFDLPGDASELADVTAWEASLVDSSKPFIEVVTKQNLSAMLACLPSEASIAKIFASSSSSVSPSSNIAGLNTLFGAGDFPAAPIVGSSTLGVSTSVASVASVASVPSSAAPVAVPVPPSPAPAAPSIKIPYSDEGETIWFETRSMTGGSRNILDLSKKSLVNRGDPAGTIFDLGDPRFMRGAVEFFSLNPVDTHRTKDVILQFEGIDYTGNTILFPVGNKANGTWRLQIKGASATGKAITEAFREKYKDYLVNKLITFTRARHDYFYMSVFDAKDMPKLEGISRILARNGETNSARRLGLL